MRQYTNLLERIIKEGDESSDRTGTGTVKIFGHQSVYHMDDGFPLMTMKKTWMPGVTHELLWFLGNHKKDPKYADLPMTNIKYLTDNKVHIWDEWADEDGNLGPVYGKQWVDWGGYFSPGHWNSDTNSTGKYWKGINQIQNIIDKLTEGHDKFNPMDRGLIINAWNVGELEEMALRPCHAFMQFNVRERTLEERVGKDIIESIEAGKFEHIDAEKELQILLKNFKVPKYELSLQLYQRSADTFLGVPFNIASYSLFLHMVCHVTGMKPGKFVHTFGDAHIYNNHKEQVNKLLLRTYRYGSDNGPVKSWEDMTEDDPNYFNLWEQKDKNWTLGKYYGPILPKLWLNPEVKNIFDFTYNDIKVKFYYPLPHIKAPIAV